ncbi:glycosyltransferase family 39 protein [bacterium]|nr:glycosyltransferase family 39 protein [bacterium]
MAVADETSATRAPDPTPRGLRHARALLALAAAAAIAASLHAFQGLEETTRGWWLLALGLALGTLGQLGVAYPAPPPGPPPLPPSRARFWIGGLLAVAGIGLWTASVLTLLRGWVDGFDQAWAGWLGATILLAVGTDLAWGVWPARRPRLWTRGALLLALALLAVAAIYRLGNIGEFPGEGAISQIEDLQVGNFGQAFLNGYRLRWEYLSSTWLAALGLWLGGVSQAAVRVPFAAVSALKLLPIFAWLRLSVGTRGAAVGCALLAVSFWDVVLSRIPNNHNVLAVAVAFALLAGPARRGRPSAYVILGFLGGYILHEYIAYRPLAIWAVVGAAWWSLADRTSPLAARLARPLLTALLIASMIAPLFITRIPGEFRREYYDGWERARGITAYYNPDDTWEQGLQRRVARVRDAIDLFVHQGDRSPVRNMRLWPLVDPVTAALLVLGLAGALAHARRPVFLLTAAGFAVHVLGTLVFTGNFDVARVGGSAGFVYVLAGMGAAGLTGALEAAWGRHGKRLALALLAAAVAWAGWWNTDHLRAFWGSTEVRRAHRNNLAYLTIWVREHRRPDERVLGVAPLYTNAIKNHDGIWLLGGAVPGALLSDVDTALRAWPDEPGPTLFVLFVERNTDDVAAYLHWLLPDVDFRIDRDPLEMGGDVAYAHVPAMPADLRQRLAATACNGAVADFVLRKDANEVVARQRAVVPFIDRSVWPDALMQQIPRLMPTRMSVRITAPITIATGGEYRFALDTYGGMATLLIDGQRRDGHGFTPSTLAAGPHDLVVEGQFSLVSPSISLRWSGPDSQNRQELMPLYRLAAPAADCPFPPPGDGHE